ncbi:Protein SERAC1, partial [Lachnellula suecica]
KTMSWLNPWSKAVKADQSRDAEEGDASLSIPDDTLGLHTLYEPKNGKIELEIPSIVAVHGLGGDSFSTWTDKSSGCLWLRDLLPDTKPLKEARIMTWGYDARAFVRPFEKSTTGRTFTFAEALLFDLFNARTSEESKSRPLIFVGHSLGGNVIKSALVGANNQQGLYGDILKSTRCLVFFGTPHQGADAAVWGTYLGNLAKGLGIRNAEVTRELQRWSNPLVELRVSFAQLAPRFLIRTFFETKKKYNVLVWTLLPPKAVGLDNADHLQICKFRDAANSNAKRVLQTFGAVSNMIKAQAESVGVVQYMPSLSERSDGNPKRLSPLEERLASLRN